jgi:hypothetical protein
MLSTVTRRTALQMTLTGTVVAGFHRLLGHDLKPGDPLYQFEKYESITNRELTIRQVYEWPNISNPIIFANISNGLNGFQFSYDIPPDQTQVVVQSYSAANAAVYDDYIWQKYKFGVARNIKDPATGDFAVRNIFYPSTFPAPGSPPDDRSDPFYSDTSIQGLQRRGVLFLC